MASTTTENPFPLATETPYGNDGAGGTVDNEAGASGSSSGAVNISQNALIAIIVVVCVVAVLGISTAILFYLTKKKEWKLREKMRRSAKKVVTALTPRRTEFPRSVKESAGGRASRGRVRIEDDVPPTPRLRPEDIEKGHARSGLRESPEGRGKGKKWPLR